MRRFFFLSRERRSHTPSLPEEQDAADMDLTGTKGAPLKHGRKFPSSLSGTGPSNTPMNYPPSLSCQYLPSFPILRQSAPFTFALVGRWSMIPGRSLGPSDLGSLNVNVSMRALVLRTTRSRSLAFWFSNRRRTGTLLCWCWSRVLWLLIFGLGLLY